MSVTVKRGDLLQSISKISGAIDKKQTLPILANVLIKVANNKMYIIATDLGVEISTINLIESGEDLAFTAPFKKLSDICKSLTEDNDIKISFDNDKALIKSGRSRFSIGILPAADYPSLDTTSADYSFTIESRTLKELLDSTAFSMALHDARYYLNGMLLDYVRGKLRCVATDGHRLAICERSVKIDREEMKLLLPRKAILELIRILDTSEQPVTVEIGAGFCRFKIADTVFTSKLIDGKYPDYERVIPKYTNKTAIANRTELKGALVRSSILSNEKYKGVKLTFKPELLEFESNNADHENLKDEIALEYHGDEISIGFNIYFLLDAINTMGSETVVMDLTDSQSSIVLRNPTDPDVRYVVMPMRL